ncbi:MAG: hypothetical protein DIU79_02495, partial [Actinobacteria bacterium]
LRTDVVVVEHPGFFLSQDDNPSRSVGEPLEHALVLLTCRAPWSGGASARTSDGRPSHHSIAVDRLSSCPALRVGSGPRPLIQLCRLLRCSPSLTVYALSEILTHTAPDTAEHYAEAQTENVSSS